MADVPLGCEDADSRPTAERRSRPWPITAVTLWLALQPEAFVLRHIIEWDEVAALVAQTLSSVLLVGAAFFAILTTLRGWANAWYNAVFVQGLSLALGIALYAGSRPFYAYLIMAYAVLAVIYLLLPGVQAAFLPIADEGENGAT